MERTVPTTESEEVDLYQRTYYSLLRSSAEVKIRTLEEVHAGMNSLLHPAARESTSDMAAFIYSILRLPACIVKTQLVVLGQNAEVFERAGFEDLRSWQEVYASARRRRSFYNGKDVLAFFIASRSDIDDVIPLLTAYQIEWNKLHQRLKNLRTSGSLRQLTSSIVGYSRLAEMLEVPEEDFDRLFAIWDQDFAANLERIAETPCDLAGTPFEWLLERISPGAQSLVGEHRKKRHPYSGTASLLHLEQHSQHCKCSFRLRLTLPGTPGPFSGAAR